MEAKDREIALGKLLNKKQIEQLKKVIDNLGQEKIDCMSPEYSKRLKSFLGNMKEELNEKGVDSDYLAYSIVAIQCKKRKTKY